MFVDINKQMQTSHHKLSKKTKGLETWSDVCSDNTFIDCTISRKIWMNYSIQQSYE